MGTRYGMGKSRDYTINAVKRALNILMLFNKERQELTLSEISELSGIGKSSVLRLMYTLHEEGFVSYDEETRKYNLGIKMYQLGITKFESLDIRKIARKWLQKLADDTNMICYLAVRKEDMLLMVDKIIPGSIPVWTQLTIESGGCTELYSTGIGRLFLSQDNDEEVMGYLNRHELKKFTEHTVVDKSKLLDLVRKARCDKFSVSNEEEHKYICSLCAPIYDRLGTMCAGISLCGLKDEIYGFYEEYLNMIRTAAVRISREIGYFMK